MSTKIEWTDETWNPVVGCTKVSAGCQNCYAERMAFRQGHMGTPKYQGIADDFGWTGNIFCDEKSLDIPLHWKKPRQIFVCSMSDLFHESVPFEFIDKVMAIIAVCPQHTFQVLTKQPHIMNQYIKLMYEGQRLLGDSLRQMGIDGLVHRLIVANALKGVISNLWLGVTAENQECADERIPILLQIPAAQRFVSIEPMLGPVDLKLIEGHTIKTTRIENGKPCYRNLDTGGRLSHVILGGESGPKARPMHPDWVRFIRDECIDAGVPFFFKQWGEWIYADGIDWAKLPEGHLGKPSCKHIWLAADGKVLENPDAAERHERNCELMVRVGKKKAGCLLDGREHKEMPSV